MTLPWSVFPCRVVAVDGVAFHATAEPARLVESTIVLIGYQLDYIHLVSLCGLVQVARDKTQQPAWMC